MVWVRRVLASLLTLVLLLSLVATALSASANSAVAHPQKVETWLNQSGLYQKFIANAVSQAEKAAGSTEAQGSVTLSDSAVQQAANSAFTNSLLQRSLSTFLNSNYAWLEGKTSTPEFTIDLTQAKQNFADQIGTYVQNHIANLPVCTTQQLSEIGSPSNVDPLNISCRPSSLDPKAEANLVVQKVENSGDFLSNPVISANNINPNGGSQAEPYYQKFSGAPAAYQAAVRLPWVYAAVAVVSALGAIFLARSRRKGLQAVAGALLAAGALLLIIRFTADTVLSHLEKHIFNQTSVGQLQQALTGFLGKVEHQMAKIDLWFAIVYLALAVIIFLILLSTRRRPGPERQPSEPDTPAESGPLVDRTRSAVPSQQSGSPQQTPTRPRPTGPPSSPPQKPKKRPPRLIQ